MEAPCVDGLHHVTDQVDLSSQMLNSREPQKREEEGSYRQIPRSWGSSPGLEG